MAWRRPTVIVFDGEAGALPERAHPQGQGLAPVDVKGAGRIMAGLDQAAAKGQDRRIAGDGNVAGDADIRADKVAPERFLARRGRPVGQFRKLSFARRRVI